MMPKIIATETLTIPAREGLPRIIQKESNIIHQRATLACSDFAAKAKTVNTGTAIAAKLPA
jgi:hypothetical protein